MIKMNDFGAEPEELRREEWSAVQRVFESGTFILGKEVEQFEREWSRFCETRHCVTVGNGTEALQLGLRALGIGPGDEVITTAVTAVSTVLAIIHSGATPVLADIKLDTALLDVQAAERCLSPKTKAVLLVHLYGHVHQMSQWMEFCRRAKIHLLEDCAQAHGARYDGRCAGAFGTWGAFSFYPTKNLGARGDGGALMTNSDEIAQRVKTLRNCGIDRREAPSEFGFNSRLDEMQAAILSVRVQWLQRFNARRQRIAQRYFEELNENRIEFLSEPAQPEQHVYHLFVVRSRQRERLIRTLSAQGVQALVHYSAPIHHNCFSNYLHYRPNSLPNAEKHAQECLSLPCHPQLSDEDVTRVIEVINRSE